MINYVQQGKTVTMTAPANVSAGGGALVGTMFGIAVDTVLSGVQGEFMVQGIFDVTRQTGASTAWTEGAAIYWDNTNKRVTKTSTANTKIGVGVLPVPADGDATGRVRLNGSF